MLSLDEEKGRKVFHAMLKVAKELEMDCVVEGVETQAQLDLIPQTSAISIQGWYYAKSMPHDALLDYIHVHSATPYLNANVGSAVV